MLKQWLGVEAIYVACPGGFATGGTELLHQLVHTLRQKGRNAYIFYYERPEQGRPPVFDCYDTPVGQPQSDARHLVIVPETGTHVLKQLPRARKCIWWLSVDNYFAFYRYKRRPGFWRRIKERWRKLSAYRWQRDRDLVHLVQCRYAFDFLAEQNIASHFLGDYLRDNFLSIDAVPDKQDWVCFNPKKGLAFTRQLMAAPVPWKWVELANMTPEQMRQTLLSSKVYIDFGHHPGKDRIPREAAMAGCVVITGREGSAANEVDVPIPAAFKIDAQAEAAPRLALEAIGSAIADYTQAVRAQDGYRRRILEEKPEFHRAIEELFCSKGS